MKLGLSAQRCMCVQLCLSDLRCMWVQLVSQLRDVYGLVGSLRSEMYVDELVSLLLDERGCNRVSQLRDICGCS